MKLLILSILFVSVLVRSAGAIENCNTDTGRAAALAAVNANPLVTTQSSESPPTPPATGFDSGRVLNLFWQPWEIDSAYNWTDKGLKEKADNTITDKPQRQSTYTTGLVYKLTPGIIWNILNADMTKPDYLYKQNTPPYRPFGNSSSELT